MNFLKLTFITLSLLTGSQLFAGQWYSANEAGQGAPTSEEAALILYIITQIRSDVGYALTAGAHNAVKGIEKAKNRAKALNKFNLTNYYSELELALAQFVQTTNDLVHLYLLANYINLFFESDPLVAQTLITIVKKEYPDFFADLSFQQIPDDLIASELVKQFRDLLAGPYTRALETAWSQLQIAENATGNFDESITTKETYRRYFEFLFSDFRRALTKAILEKMNQYHKQFSLDLNIAG